MDPKTPGAVDEILNLGEYWERQGIVSNKEDIKKTSKTISNLFKRAYRYFFAAKSVRDDMESIYEQAFDKRLFYKGIKELKQSIFKDIDYNRAGRMRHLFGSALSPNGLVDYYETIVESMQIIYYIKGRYCFGISELMKSMAQEAVQRGLDVEVYHEPLDEKNVETLLIPKLNVALTSSPKYEEHYHYKMTLDEWMNPLVLKEYEQSFEEDEKIVRELIDKGLLNIENAKSVHDQLEKFYIGSMDFKKVNELKERIINEILQYAHKDTSSI